jgi:hypothetical protein
MVLTFRDSRAMIGHRSNNAKSFPFRAFYWNETGATFGARAIMSAWRKQMSIEINLPESLSIRRNGGNITMDLTALSADIVTRLVVHGLEQKIGDAAAGATKAAGFDARFKDLSEEEQAKVAEFAESAMGKVWDALAEGNWGVERSGGEAVDENTRAIRAVLAPIVKKAFDGKNGADSWKALDDAERAAIIDAQYAALNETDTAKVDARADAKKAEWAAARAAKSEMSGIALDF